MKLFKKIIDWYYWITLPKLVRDDLKLIELQANLVNRIIKSRKTK